MSIQCPLTLMMSMIHHNNSKSVPYSDERAGEPIVLQCKVIKTKKVWTGFMKGNVNNKWKNKKLNNLIAAILKYKSSSVISKFQSRNKESSHFT